MVQVSEVEVDLVESTGQLTPSMVMVLVPANPTPVKVTTVEPAVEPKRGETLDRYAVEAEAYLTS